MSGLFAENPCYVKHETQLKQLHRMIAEDRGDSEEADALRDEMDATWWPLTKAEQERVSSLSADLYMLQDDEVFEPADGRSKSKIGQLIYVAIARGKYEEALELMRKPNMLSKDRIAAMRARCYERLGHADTSLLFSRYANKLSPHNAVYKGLLLNRLAQNGYLEEAVALADGWLVDTTLPLLPRVLSANILLQARAQQLDTYQVGLYEHIIDVLRSAQEPSSSPVQVPVQVTAYEVIGFCHYMLGQLPEAMANFKQAMQLEPRPALQNIIEHLNRLQSGIAHNSVEFQHLALSDLMRVHATAIADDSYALVA